jgi:hypothetical protein
MLPDKLLDTGSRSFYIFLYYLGREMKGTKKKKREKDFIHY